LEKGRKYAAMLVARYHRIAVGLLTHGSGRVFIFYNIDVVALTQVRVNEKASNVL